MLTFQLLCFLNACDGTEDTIKVIDLYYKTKKSFPDMFTNRDPYCLEVEQSFKNQFFIRLPVTPDNCSVFHFSLSNSTASNYIHENNTKTFIMALGLLKHLNLFDEMYIFYNFFYRCNGIS